MISMRKGERKITLTIDSEIKEQFNKNDKAFVEQLCDLLNIQEVYVNESVESTVELERATTHFITLWFNVRYTRLRPYVYELKIGGNYYWLDSLSRSVKPNLTMRHYC